MTLRMMACIAGIASLPAQAQGSGNNCREIDYVYERIVAGQVRMDSTYELGGPFGIDMSYYEYLGSRLVSIDRGGLTQEVTYPSPGRVHLEEASLGLASDYFLDAAGRVDSAEHSSFFFNSWLKYAYSENSIVVRTETDILGVEEYSDSIVFGGDTRIHYLNLGGGYAGDQYCRSEGSRCLCFQDEAFSLPDTGEYEHYLAQGRLQRILNDRGIRVLEHYWPGGPGAVRPPGSRLAREWDGAAYRLDGRRIGAVPGMRTAVRRKGGMPAATVPAAAHGLRKGGGNRILPGAAWAWPLRLPIKDFPWARMGGGDRIPGTRP